LMIRLTVWTWKSAYPVRTALVLLGTICAVTGIAEGKDKRSLRNHSHTQREPAKIEQAIPVVVVAGEAGDFEAKHDADMAESDFDRASNGSASAPKKPRDLVKRTE
jgi:hypothetical protein